MTSIDIHRARSRTAGFTLVELLIYLAILGIMMVFFFVIFDLQMKTARTQTQIADMQSNLRVARHDISRFTRMAGRGGLPAFFTPGAQLPNGIAIQVANNVAGAAAVVAGLPVVPGTDILTIRGVLFNPVYQIDADAGAFAAGTLTVDYLNPLGTPQDLTALVEAVDRFDAGVGSGEPEVLIAVSPLGSNLYAPFKLIGGSTSSETINGEDYTNGVDVNFSWDPAYSGLVAGGVQPAAMTSVQFIGVLEEYRYFIRAARAVPNVLTTTLIPRLSRVRFYPGTNIVHPTFIAGGVVQPEDISDYIMDLQIALGVDNNGNGIVDENPASPDADEWLFNDAGDVVGGPGGAWNGSLDFVRISLLARTSRHDPRHQSPRIVAIEDHQYNEPTVPATEAARQARMFRRRLSQSVVELRNF